MKSMRAVVETATARLSAEFCDGSLLMDFAVFDLARWRRATREQEAGRLERQLRAWSGVPSNSSRRGRSAWMWPRVRGSCLGPWPLCRPRQARRWTLGSLWITATFGAGHWLQGHPLFCHVRLVGPRPLTGPRCQAGACYLPCKSFPT